MPHLGNTHRFTLNGGHRLSVLLAVACCLLVLVSSTPAVGSSDSIQKSVFFKSHQAGVRVGGWSNLGGVPADSVKDAESDAYFLTDFSNGNIYIEGYLAYRFSSALMGELSVGIVNRGDVILVPDTPDQSKWYVGNLLAYPVLLKLRLYPFGCRTDKLHPYLTVGGGFYYAHHNIQLVSGTSSFFLDFAGEDSETTFGYVVGTGVDWSVASMIALDMSLHYTPINFSSELIGVQDYSAWNLTVGIKYLFTSHEK